MKKIYMSDFNSDSEETEQKRKSVEAADNLYFI